MKLSLDFPSETMVVPSTAELIQAAYQKGYQRGFADHAEDMPFAPENAAALPRSPLTLQQQGPLLRGEDMGLTQLGWLGRSGIIYGLHDGVIARAVSEAAYTPLYVQVGVFKKTEDGQLYLDG